MASFRLLTVNISEPFIQRPVATSLLMAGMIIMGLLGYSMLPISALPSVDFPTIQVTAQYPGASPEVMASSVTTPLERQFGQISADWQAHIVRTAIDTVDHQITAIMKLVCLAFGGDATNGGRRLQNQLPLLPL